MIKLKVYLEDISDGISEKIIDLPCNLNAELERDHEYVITCCDPDLALWQYDDVYKLNNVLDEINSENPDMTAEFLAVLLEASESLDIFDEKFIRKVEDNDFLFDDISHITWAMCPNEIAACYLATERHVPFDKEMSREVFECLSNEELVDYINWEDIWRQYEFQGFKLVETGDRDNEKAYLVHWI